MTKFFILLLLPIPFSTLFADDTAWIQQTELERLSLLIQEHPEPDTFRVQLLMDYGQLCLYNLDFLNGLKAVDEARSISEEIDFIKGEGLYLKSMAIFYQGAYLDNIFIENSHRYYEVLGNRILNRYTNFDIFGSVKMPYGLKHLETNNIISNLQEALSYFTNLENKEIVANIHYALSLVSDSTNKDISTDHKKSAQNLFHELGLFYHELTIITNEIKNLWQAGKDNEAKELEIIAIERYTDESDRSLKALCASLLGRTYSFYGRTNLGLEFLFEAEELLQEMGEKDLLKNIYLTIAAAYEWYLQDSEKAVRYIQKELDLRNVIRYQEGIEFSYVLYLESLLSLHRVSEFPEAYMDYLKIGPEESTTWFHADVLWNKGRMLQAQGKSKEAQLIFQESMSVYQRINDRIGGTWPAMDLAESLMNDGDLRNAIKFALVSYEWASEGGLLSMQFRVADLLSQLYEEMGQNAKAFDYLKLSRTHKDKNEELNSAARISELELQSILKKRQREIELLESESKLREQRNKTQRIWIFSIAGALVSVTLLTFILVRNNRQKQKANFVLETTLNNLKSTQAQLIQSEKMASLGELTAGIAHEIQNPLNFVNNFSEVNKELFDELQEEIEKGDKNEIAAILKDLKDNEDKIILHGKRADSIVKNMLLHSRTSSGEKQLVDINGLCGEYLRLAFHGFRAKDKNFNASFNTDFDETLPKIEAIPQDLGRAMLNLINNAFYAVDKKVRENQENYKPMVVVSTKLFPSERGKGKTIIQISISDNGPGIPDEIKDKIFQPFFTTKPTGQGTGLGLSLSYDVIKTHGGEIRLVSQGSLGSKFVIMLPV